MAGSNGTCHSRGVPFAQPLMWEQNLLNGQQETHKPIMSFSEQKLSGLLSDLHSELAALLNENRELKARLNIYERSFGVLPLPLDSDNGKASQFQRLSGHNDGIWDVDAAKWNADVVVTASADHTAIIWDTQRGERIFSYVAHRGSVNSARLHPHIPLVCTASGDRSVHLFRCPLVDIEERPASRNKDDPPESKADAKDISLIPMKRSRSNSWPRDSVSDSLSSAQAAGRDTATFPPLSMEETLDTPLLELQGLHKGPISAATWVSDGSYVCSGAWDSTVVVSSIAEGRSDKHIELRGHSGRVTDVRAHPSINNHLILSSATDGSFRVWDCRTGKSVMHMPEAHSSPVNTAQFFPNSEFLVASTGDDKTIHSFDTRHIKGSIATVHCGSNANRLSFSPSGHILSAPLDDGSLHHFDTADLNNETMHMSNMKSEGRMLSAVCWSSDEQHVMSAGWDLMLYRWSAIVL